MRYLIDTHIYIWMLMDPGRLKSSVKTALEDARNPIFVSAVTGAEIAIKTALGKIRLDTDENEEVTRRGLLHLPLTFAHTAHLKDLAPHHKDPFDRLLIAQAIHEELTLITDDPQIHKYPVKLFET